MQCDSNHIELWAHRSNWNVRQERPISSLFPNIANIYSLPSLLSVNTFTLPWRILCSKQCANIRRTTSLINTVDQTDGLYSDYITPGNRKPAFKDGLVPNVHISWWWNECLCYAIIFPFKLEIIGRVWYVELNDLHFVRKEIKGWHYFPPDLLSCLKIMLTME